MAVPQKAHTTDDELFDLEHLAHRTHEDDFGDVIQHPTVSRTLMSVDEKLYQPAGTQLEATAYENLSLAAEDDTDAGFDRWDY